MRINYLNPEGEIFGHSSELPAKEWHAVLMEILGGKLPPLPDDVQADVDAEQQREGSGQMDLQDAGVIVAYTRLQKPNLTEEEQRELSENIQSGCISLWLTTPTIIESFEKNAETMDGFVKITDTGLETGWMPRSQ